MQRRNLLAAAVWAGLPPVAWSQAGERPLRLVVGFPPGTGPDVVARTLAQRWGGHVVVDNRAGAGGQIAAQAVARSAPDGATLLLGEVGSISIAPAAYSKLPYDPARELVAVSEVVRSDFVLVVPAASPARDLKALIEAARAEREGVHFATFGAGTPGHFAAEVLASLAGFKVEPVHYRATGDAITALVAGDVKGAFVSTALAVPQVKAGKVRALATTAAQRSPLLPEVPTFGEAGWPKVDVSAWFAVLAPAGTPDAVLDTLSRQVVEAMQGAELKQKLQDAGFTVRGTPRADTDRLLKAEAQRWADVVKASGFKAD